MADDQLRRTPLYPLYEVWGGKTIDFGGWELPVQYSGILAEHLAVRTKVGLFDVSHMGEIEVSGPSALQCLQQIVTNNVARLEIGQALYSPFCQEDGGTIDDVLIYRLENERYLVVVNASNIEKDFAWFLDHAQGAQVVNQSAQTVQLALQGPEALSVLQALTAEDVSQIAYYTFRNNILVAGVSCLVSRTGYTGEDGFELYTDSVNGPALFSAILEAGKEHGIMPIGLGARDTLRLEARLPLYGHELTNEITPLEAGLSMFVKFDKGPFIGREALLQQKEKGLARKIVGFELTGRGIARAGFEVWVDGRLVGHVTSGTMGPSLQKSIGLALLSTEVAEVGRAIEVDVRGKKVAGVIVKTPFYKRPAR
ncbi:MAG: glycine cleavage system aminomethyltransferase GcvT [Firmicutes bacterium]|nr:glycine cleavage system aminomethyltransferase GcvT [Bacillota bacterium]